MNIKTSLFVKNLMAKKFLETHKALEESIDSKITKRIKTVLSKARK